MVINLSRRGACCFTRRSYSGPIVSDESFCDGGWRCVSGSPVPSLDLSLRFHAALQGGAVDRQKQGRSHRGDHVADEAFSRRSSNWRLRLECDTLVPLMS
ncbi:hypothetical protein QFZ96_002452 [Paraburkholderia youngii]